MNKYIWLCFGTFMLSLTACTKQGKPLPAMNMKAMDGHTWTNQQLEGKVVVINVWATWCGTCIQEIPELNALVAKYEGEDVVFLAFNDEAIATVQSSLERFPFHYIQLPNANDYTSKLQSRLIKTYPQNLVVGRNGKVVFDVSDGQADIYQQLQKTINKALLHD